MHWARYQAFASVSVTNENGGSVAASTEPTTAAVEFFGATAVGVS